MTRSLTREEAVERAGTVSATSYDIALDLRGAATEAEFVSVTTLRFDATPGASCFVEVQSARLHSAVLNGTPLDIATAYDAGAGRLQLAELDAQNELVIDAVMAYSHDGEGLHRHVDPADGNTYLYATSALTCAPRWFACFDQPDLKARITLDVTTPAEWSVIGNGPGTQIEPGRWIFAETPPMPSYVATVCAGPWHSVRAEHHGGPPGNEGVAAAGGIVLGIHARASLAAALDRDGEDLLQFTADCMDEFHRLFGVHYPWGEYHQVFCPDFNWGAMENVGCVTIRDQYMFRGRATTAELAGRASTIAHEMAHMWFGNLVTFRWWEDMWLNEAFAEYLGYRVTDAVSDAYAPWIDFGIVRKAWGYNADRRPSTHPIAGVEIKDAGAAENAFDGISYAKGASVVRQVATYLGEDVFLTGLRAYFHAHEYGNATFADLIAAWTEAGAVDLDTWAEQWLRTSGVDTLAVERGKDGAALLRTVPSGDRAGRPHALTVTSFDAKGRELRRTPLYVKQERTPLQPLPAQAALVLPDALDQTWAKVSLPDTEWRSLPSFVSALPTASRVSVANALRLAVADAELNPTIAVAVVAALLSTETDESMITSLSKWGTETLCASYLSPGANRDASLALLAQAATVLLRSAEPGSGRQLTAARAFVASTPENETLRAWLGGEVPHGVELDADLRWAVLAKLVSRGVAGEAEIADEAARDVSATGAVNAVRLRALQPDEAAKAAAWTMLMQDEDASNYALYAAAEGFWHPAQTELTAAYVPRFFGEISATASFRSGWVLSRLALLAYPWTAVDSSTVKLTERLLRRKLPETLRRSLVDAGDDLKRALTSRLRFS
ncbi:MAG TPA: aminopeptidase N [Jatrophihabitans sp.]